jgi:hypothetical protein
MQAPWPLACLILSDRAASARASANRPAPPDWAAAPAGARTSCLGRGR